MNWKHRTSMQWLQRRRGRLTASAIHSLVPYTATGRPKKITDADLMKVYAKMQAIPTEDDCISSGAAARGHIMEPYAIESFNQSITWAEKLFHWDDVCIYGDPSQHPLLAWSPDALSVPENSHDLPLSMGEVKSYAADKHLLKAMSDPMALEERWQIATAMAVSPSIDIAYLILFNPDMPASMQLYYHRYTRLELKEEIKTVCEIERSMIDLIDRLPLPTGYSSCATTEQIWKENQFDQEITPS